jgi:peptide/nickel transport system permease protein
MGLRGYIFKRIVYSFVLLILVLALNFIIFWVMPGDPISLFINPVKGSEELRRITAETLKNLWGIGDPLPVQFLRYLQNMLTWQFGQSFVSFRPIASELQYYIPFTILLMGGSTVLSIVFGVIFGVLVAHKRGGKFDSSMVITSLIFYSLPTFWMGMIFIIVFSSMLGWFPIKGAYPSSWTLPGRWPNALTVNPTSSPQTLNIMFDLNIGNMLTLITGFAWHSFLPIMTLTLFQYGGYLLLARATMIEALTEDYVITARAKGVKERTVLFRHALKNASLPLITNAALSFGFMLSGAIITETVYTWPGIGGWIWFSIQNKDFPALQALFYIVALSVILANFISDLLYGIIDPRIKYG